MSVDCLRKRSAPGMLDSPEDKLLAALALNLLRLDEGLDAVQKPDDTDGTIEATPADSDDKGAGTSARVVRSGPGTATSASVPDHSMSAPHPVRVPPPSSPEAAAAEGAAPPAADHAPRGASDATTDVREIADVAVVGPTGPDPAVASPGAVELSRRRPWHTVVESAVTTPTTSARGRPAMATDARATAESTGLAPPHPPRRWRVSPSVVIAIVLVLATARMAWPSLSQHILGGAGSGAHVTSVHEIVPQAADASEKLWGSHVTRPDRYATPGECLRDGYPRGLVLAYHMVTGTEGGWVVSWPTPFDASSFTDLVLWVKADRPSRTFAVGVKDQHHEEKIETGGHAVGREWTEWRIPLSSFGPVEMGAVGNVNIGFNASDGAGRLCVGSIAFVS